MRSGSPLRIFALCGYCDYSSFTGAPTGQAPAQAPHSRHSSASITYLSSPSVMHPTGHSSAQAPHLMQSSVILKAILSYLRIYGCHYCITTLRKIKRESVFFIKNAVLSVKSAANRCRYLTAPFLFRCCLRCCGHSVAFHPGSGDGSSE